MSFCRSFSPVLINGPTNVLNLPNWNHVGAPAQHRLLFTSTLRHCLARNKASWKCFFYLRSAQVPSAKKCTFSILSHKEFSYRLIWSKAVNVYVWFIRILYAHMWSVASYPELPSSWKPRFTKIGSVKIVVVWFCIVKKVCCCLLTVRREKVVFLHICLLWALLA